MSTVAKAAAVSLLMLVAVLVAGYFVLRRMPDLLAPISIEDEMWVADGGSFHIVLRDARNRRYAIGVEGSLGVPPSSFEVYVQEGQALLAAVEAWSKQLADPKPKAQSLAQVARVLRSRKS